MKKPMLTTDDEAPGPYTGEQWVEESLYLWNYESVETGGEREQTEQR